MKRAAGACVLLLAMTACRTKQGYVEKGNQLFDAGRYADAVINYDRAIQKDRNYGEAYYRLGMAQEKLQDGSAAFDAFYRAVQLMPADIPAKEHLGNLSLEFYMLDSHRPQAYYNLAKQISDELLQRNPRSFEGLREKGYLAMTDQKREDAIALFRKAHDINPSDPAVTTALAQNLFLTGQSAEAEKLGSDMMAHHTTYPTIYDIMYEWYVKQNRPADAENTVKAKVNNNPKEGRYLLELAAHYDRVRKPAEMQAALQRLLDRPKDFPQARMWVGQLYYRMRNYSEAVHYFQEGARNSKGEEKLQYQKAATNALLAEGKREQASTTVNQIVEETPKDPESRLVQANLLLKSGDPAQVAAAERALQDLAKLKPNDASILVKLGRAEELQGNFAGATSRYQEALKHNAKSLEARYALAELGITQRHPEETLQQADEILKVRPDDPTARLLRAQGLARTGNVATARAELTRIKDFQHNPQAQVELGLLALSERKYPEAEQIFSKLRESGDPKAVVGLAQAYAAQKEFDRALGVLNEGLKKSNSTLLLVELGRIQAVAGHHDAAIQTFQQLVSQQPKSVAARVDLAQAFAGKDDYKSAVETYKEAIKLSPSDLSAGLELGHALSQAGRVEEARTQYLTVLKLHPADAIALNEMANFVCENGGDVDQAMEFAQRALRTAPAQPAFSDTMGCLYLKKGLRDSALQVFGNLVKKYPNYPTFRYHLGAALLEKGDKKSAKKELQGALADHPSRQDEARIRELLGKIG